jgi:hypothetical protein
VQRLPASVSWIATRGEQDMALLSIRMKQKIGPVGELLGCLSGNKARSGQLIQLVMTRPGPPVCVMASPRPPNPALAGGAHRCHNEAGVLRVARVR